ncbi:hypothetical protein P168DRAFT_283799 [Aspergillus campestris IBT 28561]|uniref:Uncharacterized protein n=1 Tax=Aspergillus campestris (strain IBT 28561) TaxID=1392248 RepID=A0A2I1CWN2_ASPC2|nr:uncharacterized protein P168DRAFT_283799 [Aspergillus campestris IBT 28561]PKY02037.1 hypothetical protein P168DRAFT_283799 [Aspergillus campestris IBT 28561]
MSSDERFSISEENTPPPSPPNVIPAIVLISPKGIHFFTRYRAILRKMNRDVELYWAPNIKTLNGTIQKHSYRIAGFIISDAAIMDPEHEELAQRVASLPRTPGREWAVVFAFDFPSQAARAPFRFNQYLETYFGLGWRMCGKTENKIKMKLRTLALRKVAKRVYRTEYEFRGVFIRGVKQGDKFLVTVGEFSSGGQPDENLLEEETSSTAVAEIGDGSSDVDSQTPVGRRPALDTTSHFAVPSAKVGAPDDDDTISDLSQHTAADFNYPDSIAVPTDDENNLADDEESMFDSEEGEYMEFELAQPIAPAHILNLPTTNSSNPNPQHQQQEQEGDDDDDDEENEVSPTPSPSTPVSSPPSQTNDPDFEFDAENESIATDTSTNGRASPTSSIDPPPVSANLPFPLPPQTFHNLRRFFDANAIPTTTEGEEISTPDLIPHDWVPSDDEGTEADKQVADSMHAITN